MHQSISTEQKATVVSLKLRTGVRAGQGAMAAQAQSGCNPLDPRGCKPKPASAQAGCSPWDPRCGAAVAAE